MSTDVPEETENGEATIDQHYKLWVSTAKMHHYCKVLEKLIAGKRQGNKDRYTASSSRLI